jgi:hypothetical protein
MNQDSQSHRATPEQWEVVEICREEGKIPWLTAAALLEPRARIEQLETALLSLTSTVAKAGNDHGSRVEALELAQRITDAYIVTAATLSPEERKELGVITVPEFKAAMARAARQGAENTMAQIRTGAPVVKEFDKGFKPPTNCRQRLQRIGMPYPKSGCDACGDMSPKWRECDAALDRLIIAEARPVGLAEQLAVLITSATTSRGAAQDVLRKVAAWLKEQERRGLVDLPEALEQEAME